MIVDENGNEIKFTMTDSLPMSGMGGTIRRTTDGDCVKLFYFNNNIYPNYKALHKIRELDLESLYKIKDFLFKDDTFSGYTMKYYQHDRIDLSIDKMSIFIDNMIRLYNDMMVLNDNHILMCDNCINNIVYSDKKVIIIDCDCYKFESGYKLHYTNLRLYLDLILGLLFNSTLCYSFKDIFKTHKLYKIFDMETFNLDKTVKLFEGYERPIDAIRDKSLIKRI